MNTTRTTHATAKDVMLAVYEMTIELQRRLIDDQRRELEWKQRAAQKQGCPWATNYWSSRGSSAPHRSRGRTMTTAQHDVFGVLIGKLTPRVLVVLLFYAQRLAREAR